VKSRTPLVIGIVVAVVAVIAVLAIVLAGGDDDDSADVEVAPPLVGQDYEGNDVEFVPGEDGPLMVVFLAHWCPHCNAEIPVLQQWEASGEIPEDLTVVGVSTAVAADRPNYPPDAWLEAMGWEWPVIADDDGTLAEAYGVNAFPYMVFIGDDGAVTATVSGEQPISELQPLADEAVGASA
jgi:thiol-disulfide isomerase/thioredoxin